MALVHVCAHLAQLRAGRLSGAPDRQKKTRSMMIMKRLRSTDRRPDARDFMPLIVLIALAWGLSDLRGPAIQVSLASMRSKE